MAAVTHRTQNNVLLQVIPVWAFSTIHNSDEWWKISEILETQFNTTLDLSLSIANLSGGELTKLFLAIGLSQQPNVLLLDEPTNHMDYLALEELSQFLKQFDGAFVIVSHKPFFLDRVVDTTWELTPKLNGTDLRRDRSEPRGDKKVS